MKIINLYQDNSTFTSEIYVEIDIAQKDLVPYLQHVLDDCEHKWSDSRCLYNYLIKEFMREYDAEFCNYSQLPANIMINGEHKLISEGKGWVEFDKFVKKGFSPEKNVIKFKYTNRHGETAIRNVEVQDENDEYLMGLDLDDDNKFKKFIKSNMSFRL